MCDLIANLKEVKRCWGEIERMRRNREDEEK